MNARQFVRQNNNALMFKIKCCIYITAKMLLGKERLNTLIQTHIRQLVSHTQYDNSRFFACRFEFIRSTVWCIAMSGLKSKVQHCFWWDFVVNCLNRTLLQAYFHVPSADVVLPYITTPGTLSAALRRNTSLKFTTVCNEWDSTIVDSK